jgi:glycosyltransferase involved in cell wall biosynthesis
MVRNVVIVQPYVPAYRVPLFDRLQEFLHDEGVALKVLVPDVKRTSARGDAATPSYVNMVSGWTRVVGGVTLSWAATRSHARRAELTVLPLQGSALDNYAVAFDCRFALWGHGGGHVKKENGLDMALERWLLRRSVHFFAYTPSGAGVAERAGVPNRQVSILFNSVDTASINEARHATTESAVQAFRAGLELHGPVMLCLGSLDESKRLDVVFRMADQVRSRVAGVSLIFAGDGPQRSEVVGFCATRSWCHYLGRVDDQQKGLLAKVAHVLVNPGRVGLVAVDSLVMQVPLVTTDWPYHAPEFEYLNQGTSVTTRDDDAAYAAGVAALLDDEPRRVRLSTAAGVSARRFSIEQVARTFAEGLMQSLAAAPPRPRRRR